MADRHIYFNLPVLNAGVKLNVGRMDVGFNDMNRANFDAINRVLHAAYGALDEGNVGAKIASYAITVNSHGSIEGTTGAEFVKPFFGRAPAGLGPTLGSGGVFYFGAHERRTGLAVVMEASSLVTDGLYTRLIFTLDGTRVRYQDVAEAGRETIRHALGAMDLQLENL
jgi:hypothetical protein